MKRNKDSDFDGMKWEMMENGARRFTRENGDLHLDHLSYLEDGVLFENEGDVWLSHIMECGEGVVFRNNGSVDLSALERIPEGVLFENFGNVWLYNVKEFGAGVRFNSQGWIKGECFYRMGIPGVGMKRVLNNMIRSLYE